jgi:group I intron endonuclease
MKIGIYQIRNKLNNKSYIGSSKNLLNRWAKEHKPSLRNNKHYNSHLQHAWNKYGESNFEFIILEECLIEKLSEREEYWIENYGVWNRNYGYNLSRYVNGRLIISEETRKKMSQAAIENWEKEKDNYYNSGIRLKIVQLFQEGISKAKISKQLKIDRNTVYSILEYHKLHTNTGKGKIIKLTKEKINEIEILKKQGLNWNEISVKSNIGKTQLNRKGICKKLSKPFTQEIKNKALELRNNGKSWKEISKEIGFSESTIFRHKLNLKNTDAIRTKITNEIKSLIFDYRKNELTMQEIANKLKIGLTTVSRILND